MPLIKTIPEIKKYVRVNFANNTASLPNMDKAERKFIIPVIGQALFDQLQEQYNNSTLSPANEKLLPRVQAALSPLAYWLELPFINAQITDAGLRKPGTDNLQPVFKHDFYSIWTALSDSGMDEMEALIAFLEANAGDYPLWVASPAYNAYRMFFVKNGTEFSQIYTLKHPRRCWMNMSSIMQLVEDVYIGKSIGAAFAAELRGLTNPDEAQQAAIALIKKAVVYLTIKHAGSQRTARLTDDGFTIQVADPDAADPSRQAAADPVLARLQQETEHIGQSYLSDLVDYLNKTASSTVFPLYYNSPLYVAPSTEPQCSINSQLKSSFSFI